MRDGWTRGTPLLALDGAALAVLTGPAFPGRRVTGHAVAEGGLANTNVRVTLAGRTAPVLVRLWVRDPGAAARELALLRLVAGRVPVPRVLHAAADNPVTGHPYAILEWVDGQRLDTAIARDAAGAAALGAAAGAALAGIHSFHFDRTGFLDAAPAVSVPAEIGGAGLAGFLHDCLVEGSGGERLGAALTDAVLAFAAREGALLDGWDGPPCLTHSDFNGSNILVRPGASPVAAVLDWEFAFSGAPFFDLGNLLRPPLGAVDGFAAAVADGYVAAGGRLPADWRRMSLLADLFAWADFLNRPSAGPALVRDARAVIVATLAEWRWPVPGR